MQTPIAIIGAGPGGATTSICLAKKGVKHVLFDKAEFPRDKICGDAISNKVIAEFAKIDANLLDGIYHQNETFLDSWGVTFVAPNGRPLDIPFAQNNQPSQYAPGFIAKRLDFDHYLIQQLDPDLADLRLGANVKALTRKPDGIEITYEQDGRSHQCLARMVIGAGGDRSVVARQLAGYRMEPDHYCAGVRGYFENVTDMHPQNFIELHFMRDLLPGYFWIFPLPGNLANVGVGLLSAVARKKHINVKQSIARIISEHPAIKPRFEKAKQIGRTTGWGLPLGSRRRKLSGDRFLLVGDAGSLIDPFTGEGIGNAVVSGVWAAQHAEAALDQNTFTASFLAEYDRLVYDQLWDELKLSRTLQNLVRFPWLFNLVVNRVGKSEELQTIFTSMFADLDARAKLSSPTFYLKLLLPR